MMKKRKTKTDNERQKAMAALRQAVEVRWSAVPRSPSEFKRLSADIAQHTGDVVSSSTLMRLWGYVTYGRQPSASTLNSLAHYVGFRDFVQFCSPNNPQDIDSDIVAGTNLNIDRELQERDHVLLRWNPGREVLVRHLGEGRFVVERSERSKLTVGDTFDCHLVIEGQPLYIDNLVHQDLPPRCYVCGMRGGVRFEIFKAELD